MTKGSVIRKVALVAALGALAACSSTAGAADPTPSAAPPATPAATVTGVKKIKHVVVLMQENRSYDSYFGKLHDEGQPASSAEPSTGNPDPVTIGQTITPFHTTQQCTVADLNHSWNGTHAEWDNGQMDGFTAANEDPSDPNGSRTMGYFDKQTLPFYYGLANTFAIADHYFASTLTQTFPNRFYLYAGTSFGHIRNDLPPSGGYPQKTVFQLLDQAHVSWKIYISSFGVEQVFSYVQKHPGHVVKMPQYYKDVAAGKLPQVAFVEADPFGDVNHESDEHPPANVQVGEKFTHDVIQALVKSPNWLSSALFLTYDEHGGYYDHVAPPAAPKPDNIAPMLQPGDTPGAFDRYGIRVPTIVVSPYSRKHFVGHTVYDHTSILRFIEKRFGLPALTNRDKAANPMLGMFDFTKVSNAKPTIVAAPVSTAGKQACIGAHPNAVPTDPANA
jgi:phospholipase C